MTTPIITFYDPKGGSGATSLACAYALLAARSGAERPVLLDLDPQFGDVAFNFGLTTEVGLGSLIRVLDEIECDQLYAAVSGDDTGLSILSAPADPAQAELITPYQIRRLLNVAAQGYGTVIVDLGPGLDERVLATLEASSWVYIVVEPTPGSVAAARRCSQVLERVGVSLAKCSVVVSKYGRAGEVRRQDIARLVSPLPVLAEIPFAPEVFSHAQSTGRPVTHDPRSPLTPFIAPIVQQSLRVELALPKRRLRGRVG